MVEELNIKTMIFTLSQEYPDLVNCFCCSWQICKDSWILNPIQKLWIFNLISNEFNIQNYYILADWVLILFYLSLILVISFDWRRWNSSYWLFTKQSFLIPLPNQIANLNSHAICRVLRNFPPILYGYEFLTFKRRPPIWYPWIDLFFIH